GEIARERERLSVELCDARASRIGRARVAVTGDVRACFGERDGDGLTQTGRSAGDERNLVVQSELVEDHALRLLLNSGWCEIRREQMNDCERDEIGAAGDDEDRQV